ncbi:MAG: OFA family MFS transporter [Oscillospiraceae bacterium]|nr:OFA family MFS transporter [Oscillospiraceae bacterium]
MNESQNVKRKGLLAVFASIAIQLTLGVAYIWSVFQRGIADSIFDGNHASAGLTFSLLLLALTIGSVIGGKLAVKYTTRMVVLIGGIILSAGFFAASFVKPEYAWLLWVTYGVMGGAGMGFTYSTTIACAQKWYPHKKGLVTGVIVSALGLGGVVFTPLVERLIKNFGGIGTGEFKTFVVLSVVFLVVCSLGSIFLVNPPAGYMSEAASAASAKKGKAIKDFLPSQMLKSPRFYIITLVYLLGCMGGLMVINFAKPIAIDKGMAEETAMIGVLAISMFNSFGRLIWGMISDKIGRKNTIIILLAGNTILSLFVLSAEGYWIYALIACVGFFYGGLISTFPSLTADIFGAKHMATNYGFVLLGFGGGAIISSQIAGYFKNAAEQAGDIEKMFPAFVIASCCAVGGIALMFVLKVINKKAALTAKNVD